MRFLTRACIATTLAAAFAVGAVPAEPTAATRARAALALAEAGMSVMPAPDRPTRPPVPAEPVYALSYADASAMATARGRMLVVWVGTENPAVERELPNAVHCRVSGFPGAVPPVPVPCVMVGVPTDGVMRRTDLPAGCTADDVRRVRLAALAPVRECSNGRCVIRTPSLSIADPSR